MLILFVDRFLHCIRLAFQSVHAHHACVFLSFCVFPILYNYEVKHLGGVEKMAVYTTLVLVVFPGMLLETFLYRHLKSNLHLRVMI